MNKANFWAGLCIMIGLIVAGMMIPQAVNTFRSYDRTVSVKGLCEREVKADKAIWPLVLKVSGDDFSSTLDEVNRDNAKVKAFLLQGGILESEITGSISISDKATMEYNNERASRYIIKSVITVCTTNVDNVVELMGHMDELLTMGIALESNDWDNQTSFSYEALNDIKPEMIEEATRNAREVAQKFALDSDSKLGKIKSATQGTFSIESRDSNTPYIKNIRVVTGVTYYLKK